jgi:hypothetical protein
LVGGTQAALFHPHSTVRVSAGRYTLPNGRKMVVPDLVEPGSISDSPISV